MLGKYGKLQLTIQNDNYQEKRDPPPPSGNRNGVILPIHGSILKVKRKLTESEILTALEIKRTK